MTTSALLPSDKGLCFGEKQASEAVLKRMRNRLAICSGFWVSDSGCYEGGRQRGGGEEEGRDGAGNERWWIEMEANGLLKLLLPKQNQESVSY